MKSVDQCEHVMVDIFPAQVAEEVRLKGWSNSLLPGFSSSFHYDVMKRGIDICGGLIGLGILLLLLPVIAVCILLEDNGPIFYRQTRIGQYGKTFSIYKIRSM